ERPGPGPGPQGRPQDLLTAAVGPGGVDDVDAQIQRGVQGADGLAVVDRAEPAGEAHGPEPDHAELVTGGREDAVFHDGQLRMSGSVVVTGPGRGAGCRNATRRSSCSPRPGV